MTSTLIEVLKQALGALEIYWGKAEHRRTREDERRAESAITSLRQAIAGLESQEPVAYCEIHHLPEPCAQCAKEHEGYNTHPPQRTEQNFCPRCGKRTNDIHTCTPPQSTWVELTDEERNAIEAATLDLHGVPKFFATAIEAKLKEKNT